MLLALSLAAAAPLAPFHVEPAAPLALRAAEPEDELSEADLRVPEPGRPAAPWVAVGGAAAGEAAAFASLGLTSLVVGSNDCRNAIDNCVELDDLLLYGVGPSAGSVAGAGGAWWGYAAAGGRRPWIVGLATHLTAVTGITLMLAGADYDATAIGTLVAVPVVAGVSGALANAGPPEPPRGRRVSLTVVPAGTGFAVAGAF